MNGVSSPPASARDPARLLAWLAAVLWLVSLFLPVVEAHQTHGASSSEGLAILTMGWLGFLAGQFGWLANPVLLLAIARLIRHHPVSPRLSLGIAVLLALLMIDALTWTDFPTDGGPGPITAYYAGYWTWIGAVAAGVGALLIRATRPV